MSETTTSSPEPATGPVATTPPPSQPPIEPVYQAEPPRRSRITAAAAWVGIVAGVVFIVAVIFFSGFILGAHNGGHRGHGGHRGDRDAAVFHRGPPMGQMGPRGEFERGGPFGPGGPFAEVPQPPQSPGPTQSPGLDDDAVTPLALSESTFCRRSARVDLQNVDSVLPWHVLNRSILGDSTR